MDPGSTIPPRDRPAISPPGPRVRIAIVSGPHQGEEFVFDALHTVVVGRADDVQWKLDRDPYFSRYHFRLEIQPPHCRLIDLDSRNGTLVNGERVKDLVLKQGDQIQCGSTNFAVEITQPRFGQETETLDLPGTQQPNAIQTLEVPPEEAPHRVADYELIQELGRGAMGVVYRALERPSGREVAVKLIQPQTIAHPRSVQLFLREASILSQLHHPRIVECLGLGSHNGQMYLAMEYIPTVSLREVLQKQSRPAQIRIACRILCSALEGLQYAHGCGIVHRDIKPANLLVYRFEKGLKVKVADFGLAKNFQNAGFSSMTQTGELRGTLGFMAPEQLIDCRLSKPAVDLYAAGACLYYYLCGKLPHSTVSGPSAIAGVLNQPPIPLADQAADIPAELASAVDRALARNASDRYSSAAHMRECLLKFTAR